MAARRLTGAASAVAAAGLVLAIVLAANVLASRRFARLDLTEERVHTISPAVRRMLAGQDDLVTVTVYFSEDLPPTLLRTRRFASDLLDEFRAYAGSRLAVEWSDPKDDPELERRLASQGVFPVEEQVLESDKLEVRRIWRALVVRFGDRQAPVPLIEEATLEYQLASAIRQVTERERSTVGFLKGHGELASDRELQPVAGELEKQYGLVDVDLSKGEPVPPSVDTLVVAGPSTALSRREAFELDQFVMRGGRLILLLNGVSVGMDLADRTVDTGLADVLASWGARVGQDLVVEPQAHGTVTIRKQMPGMVTMFMSPYPYFPVATREGLASDVPALAGLSQVAFRWASTVERTSVPAGVEARELVTTSPQAWSVWAPFQLDPQAALSPGTPHRRALALLLSGSFPSAFSEVPPAEGLSGDEAQRRTAQDASRTLLRSSPQTQVVVVGDADFAILTQQGDQGPVLLLNLVDWLTVGGDLISVRTKSVAERPIRPDLTDAEKDRLRLLATAAVPALVTAAGAASYMGRRRRRSGLAAAEAG